MASYSRLPISIAGGRAISDLVLLRAIWRAEKAPAGANAEKSVCLEFLIQDGNVLLRGELQQPGQCSKDGLGSILDLAIVSPIEMVPGNTIQSPRYPSQFVFVTLGPLW